MTSFSIRAAYSVQRLRRNGEKRGGDKKKKIQMKFNRTKRISLQENLHDLLCLFCLYKCSHMCTKSVLGRGRRVDHHISGHP